MVLGANSTKRNFFFLNSNEKYLCSWNQFQFLGVCVPGREAAKRLSVIHLNNNNHFFHWVIHSFNEMKSICKHLQNKNIIKQIVMNYFENIETKRFVCLFFFFVILSATECDSRVRLIIRYSILVHFHTEFGQRNLAKRKIDFSFSVDIIIIIDCTLLDSDFAKRRITSTKHSLWSISQTSTALNKLTAHAWTNGKSKQ